MCQVILSTETGEVISVVIIEGKQQGIHSFKIAFSDPNYRYHGGYVTSQDTFAYLKVFLYIWLHDLIL